MPLSTQWQLCEDYDIQFCAFVGSSSGSRYPSALELFTVPDDPLPRRPAAPVSPPAAGVDVGSKAEPGFGAAQLVARYPNHDMFGIEARPGGAYLPWINATGTYQGGVYGDGDERGFRIASQRPGRWNLSDPIQVRQLRHHFGPFSVQFSAPRHLSRAVWRVLLGAHANRVLIGAWNPML